MLMEDIGLYFPGGFQIVAGKWNCCFPISKTLGCGGNLKIRGKDGACLDRVAIFVSWACTLKMKC